MFVEALLLVALLLLYALYRDRKPHSMPPGKPYYWWPCCSTPCIGTAVNIPLIVAVFLFTKS